MKFSHSLKFNAVPEWQDYYVNYPALKKTIYKLQQEQVSQGFIGDLDSTTVTDLLVEEFSKDKSSYGNTSRDNKNSSSESINVNTSEVESRKFSSKLLNRFRNKTNGKKNGVSSDFDLESGSEKWMEKSNSITSFTKELEDEALLAFVSEPDVYVGEQFSPLRIFSKQLLQQLIKIDQFYSECQSKIFRDYDNLVKDLERNDIDIDEVFKLTEAYSDSVSTYSSPASLGASKKVTSINSNSKDLEKEQVRSIGTVAIESDDDDSDEEEDMDLQHSHNSALLDHSHFHVDQQKRIALKKKSTTVFIELSELKSFIELNRIGFSKITKKFDKSCNYSIRQDFVDNVLSNYSKVFVPSTLQDIDSKINQITKIYALLIEQLNASTSAADLENIKHELKSHLRDHIVWERNTVWKDLLSLEKKSYNLELHRVESRNHKMGDESNIANQDMILRLIMRKVDLPFSVFGYSSVKIPAFLLTYQVLKLTLIAIMFIILMTVKTMNDPEEHRALAVLATCALLWATEALPLYITAMFVPFLCVVCKVCKATDGNGHMTGTEAADYLFSQMWNSTIMLLMGGFTLAAALSKYNIAKIISSWMLAAAGTKPRNILLAIMSISLFLSMWISNVAAPVLCFSLIQPVLRTLPTESPLSKALVLGIALASNMAGMSSPISSPQNMIAITSMNPSPGWGKWFAVALPVSIIGMIGIWVELILTFKISDVKIQAYKPIKDKFTLKQWYITIVTIGTILLWCFISNSKVDAFLGESGIISIIPIVLFFGPGLLTTQDLNNFPWSIIVLAMGGIALGKAISSSGLLKTIAESLQHKIMDFDVFVVLIIFGALVLVVATFVSHTVAALIIIPLVQEIGENLPTPHPLLLVMGTALLASAAMGLPTSGFPNVTAISMTDELGKPYLTVNTFITRGVPASIIGYICVITIGYGIMNAIHF